MTSPYAIVSLHILHGKAHNHNTLCVNLAGRTPNVSVSLHRELTENDFSTPTEYTVLQGQMFGLVCETEPQFSANWYTIDNEPSEHLKKCVCQQFHIIHVVDR